MNGLRAYLELFRPHAGWLLAAAGLLSIASALPAGTVVLLERAVDEIAVAGRRDALFQICLAFALLAAIRGVVTVGRTWITKRVAFDVASALRRRLHRHLLEVGADASLGSRIAALTYEVDEVQYGVSALVSAVRNPLTLVGLAATAVWMAPALAPWALLLLPPVALTAWWSGERVHASASVAREARAQLSGLAADQLDAVEVIADAGAVESEVAHFAARDRADRAARVRLEVERTLPSAATQAVVAGAAAVLIWVGGGQVLSGGLQPGAFLGFAVALGLMHRPLAGLAEVWALFQRSLAALERVNAVLGQPLPRETEDPVDLPQGPAALIVVDLHAAWDPAVPVLCGVSLEVRPGEVVAIVGPSGAGKSTLLAAIRGRISPSAGQILLGEVPLDRLKRADRRRGIGWVPQDNQLLDRTIADNVCLGRPASPDAVQIALDRSGARFVRALELGMDAPVGERGRLLSGGERQRICIARALLQHPKVLLLDEATNQLDPQTEAQILADLRISASDCAIVIVAHDPSTAALADRVLRLESGAVHPERAAGPRVVA